VYCKKVVAETPPCPPPYWRRLEGLVAVGWLSSEVELLSFEVVRHLSLNKNFEILYQLSLSELRFCWAESKQDFQQQQVQGTRDQKQILKTGSLFDPLDLIVEEIS